MEFQIVHPKSDLGQVLYEYLRALPSDSNKTVDDFFTDIGIPKEERTDFAFAAILKSYKKFQKGCA